MAMTDDALSTLAREVWLLTGAEDETCLPSIEAVLRQAINQTREEDAQQVEAFALQAKPQSILDLAAALRQRRSLDK